jgi:hypothetical protein
LNLAPAPIDKPKIDAVSESNSANDNKPKIEIKPFAPPALNFKLAAPTFQIPPATASVATTL